MGSIHLKAIKSKSSTDTKTPKSKKKKVAAEKSNSCICLLLQLFVALWVFLRVEFSFTHSSKSLNSIHLLSSQSCAACCDRNCLLSTRKFVWVFLDPGLVSPGPKQIQPGAGCLLWFVQQWVHKMYPSIPSQCTFPVPVSCWISKCYRDSSRDTAAAQVVNVPTSRTWLQLVQGLFSSYCLFLFPLTRWASSQNIRLKLRPQEEWK